MESQTFQASVKAGPAGVSSPPCLFIAGLIRPATESFFLLTLEFHMTSILRALLLYLDFQYSLNSSK